MGGFLIPIVKCLVCGDRLPWDYQDDLMVFDAVTFEAQLRDRLVVEHGCELEEDAEEA